MSADKQCVFISIDALCLLMQNCLEDRLSASMVPNWQASSRSCNESACMKPSNIGLHRQCAASTQFVIAAALHFSFSTQLSDHAAYHGKERYKSFAHGVVRRYNESSLPEHWSIPPVARLPIVVRVLSARCGRRASGAVSEARCDPYANASPMSATPIRVLASCTEVVDTWICYGFDCQQPLEPLEPTCSNIGSRHALPQRVLSATRTKVSCLLMYDKVCVSLLGFLLNNSIQVCSDPQAPKLPCYLELHGASPRRVAYHLRLHQVSTPSLVSYEHTCEQQAKGLAKLLWRLSWRPTCRTKQRADS